MSGLYNMVMPRNPILKELVTASFTAPAEDGHLRVHTVPLGRVRDAWMPSEDRICILHRNYGEDDEFTSKVAETPNYLGYHSCDDETYAWWEFKVPDVEEIREFILVAREKLPPLCTHPMDRYMDIVNNMGNPDRQGDPDVQRAVSAGEQVLAGVMDAIDTGETKEVSNPLGSVVVAPIKPPGEQHERTDP